MRTSLENFISCGFMWPHVALCGFMWPGGQVRAGPRDRPTRFNRRGELATTHLVQRAPTTTRRWPRLRRRRSGIRQHPFPTQQRADAVRVADGRVRIKAVDAHQIRGVNEEFVAKINANVGDAFSSTPAGARKVLRPKIEQCFAKNGEAASPLRPLACTGTIEAGPGRKRLPAPWTSCKTRRDEMIWKHKLGMMIVGREPSPNPRASRESALFERPAAWITQP